MIWALLVTGFFVGAWHQANMRLQPLFDDGTITLYHGDARDIAPQLAAESIDLLLSDPPYGISYRSGQARDPVMANGIAGDENLNAMRGLLPHVDRLLRPDRHAYVFASPQRLGEAVDAIREWWTVKNLLVWDKGNQGTMGDLAAGFSVNWEAIIYANKGRRALTGPRPRSVIRFDWSSKRDPVHPHVKPIPLLQLLVAKSTAPGEVVFDPFAGSGTTLLAAKELGRRAIGIEIDRRFCEQAIARLTGAALARRRRS
jgi:DNA modification methylase